MSKTNRRVFLLSSSAAILSPSFALAQSVPASPPISESVTLLSNSLRLRTLTQGMRVFYQIVVSALVSQELIDEEAVNDSLLEEFLSPLESFADPNVRGEALLRFDDPETIRVIENDIDLRTAELVENITSMLDEAGVSSSSRPVRVGLSGLYTLERAAYVLGQTEPDNSSRLCRIFPFTIFC